MSDSAMLSTRYVENGSWSGVTDKCVENFSAIMHEKCSSEKMVELYDKWADEYDADNSPHGYNNPSILTELFDQQVARLFPSPDRRQLRVLDVACGTGLVGERLRELGYQRVDGVDGSYQMVEVARGKGVYDSLFVEFIENRPMTCAPPRTYDAIVTAGSFCPNHLAPSCLRHLAAVVKPGGLVAIGFRKIYGLKDPVLKDMEPELLQLHSEGLWKVALWEERPNYFKNLPGMYYILQVL